MKIARCPVCHSDLHLDALMEDDAGRELLAAYSSSAGKLRSSPDSVHSDFFGPEKSNLSNARA
ncbi:Uncharacterised protein [Leminorella grimontii]|uniref:hypothetical protein n=1 Tax=Leminorella grimontii TaxID=82981 RepID=UPI00106D4307|nr:hypothetical protein [Leminorella grimontii]VFS54599.1 Uncharacterised protein [Leminorella grimontii]